jgi:hypothetical protein
MNSCNHKYKIFLKWTKRSWRCITCCPCPICLIAKQTKGQKPLVDYSKLHIVTFDQYINILWKRAMDRVAIEEIKEVKWTKKEEK